MQIVGIDIGTTSICGVAIDAETGDVLCSRSQNSNAFIIGSAPWEKIQSVEKIVLLGRKILDELICEETLAIGVTGQMHGIVYTDKNGNAVSPLYTWQDGRGDQPYRDTTYAKFLGSYSGYGNVTDFYNRVNGLVPKSAVNYCTVHDYFVMQLCGLCEPLVHVSDAASFGCFDLLSNRFEYENNVKVINDYHVAGNYKGIPVSVAIGDNQASVFSTLADNREVLINIGTGSQVSCVSDSAFECDSIEVRPYFEGKYLLVGAALCGGRAYSLLKDFYYDVIKYVSDIGEDAVYDIMNRMLSVEEDADLTVDTRFAGTRRNSNITGSITGLNVQNFTPTQLTKGVIDGMVTELYDMYKVMKVKAIGIVGSGNGVRKNQHFVKAAERKFCTCMKIPLHIEEAAFGAAMFGAVSAGVYKNAAEAQRLIKYK